ncbi:hypothetical protein ACFLT1_06950 [Bacteroidota bacterium]
MKNIRIHLLFIALFFIGILDSSAQNPQVAMIRNILQQFEAMQPEHISQDEIDDDLENWADPDKDLYHSLLENASAMFRLEDLNSSYTEVDGKEYPVVSIVLVYSYRTLPGFQNLNVWFELSSVKDSNGKNILLSDKEKEKYYEYGIIDEGYGFSMPGEFSETIWLNREVEWEEEISIKGKLHLEYPENYESVTFLNTDPGKSTEVNGIEYTVVKIDQNIATIRFKGDRRMDEGVKMILLNSEDKPFMSWESIAIDSDTYDYDAHRVKDLSDEEIAKSLEDVDYSNFTVDQIKKIRVQGNISKLILMHVISSASLEKSFTIMQSAGY